VVEKLGELGVDRLVWLTTDHGQAKAPRREKAHQWAVSALQQSRGAWILEIELRTDLGELPEPVWVVHPGGGSLPPADGSVTLAIGPEGGFSPEEVAQSDAAVGLGARVLRVETAAVVASGLVLHHLGRMNT
jgi:16S rRNA (uracil1498-N3)-methyltransferase